jgi:hypothetical protein
MSRIYFFATAADIHPVLKHLEGTLRMKYVEEGMLKGTAPSIWHHASELHSVGMATADQEINCEPFLVMRQDVEVKLSPYRMMDGVTRLDVFPNANPDSVLLRLGGFWKDGSLISGHFIASSDQEFSRKVMSTVRMLFRKHFTKVQAYWVGSEALTRLRSGKRLCTAIQSPSEYDLREPDA